MQRPFTPLAPLLIACLLLSSGARADNKPAAAVAPAAGPKSVFVDEVDFGKDPFFPRSIRRPKLLVHTTDSETVRSIVPDFIVLKGISVLKDRKLAIINDRTVAEGEEFFLKTSGQPLKVKCLEIKDRSVIVVVNGATKELPLRAGF